MAKRIATYLLGLAITALGIALIVLSMVGAGPWDTVAVGLNKHLGLTIGTWTIISQAVVVLITSMIERKRPQYGSVAAVIIRSVFLDAWIYLVFTNIDFAASSQVQWPSFFCGVLAAGIGIGIYVEANLPKTPIDGLMVALHHRLSCSLNVSRIIIESSAVVLGFFLGGPVGIGTVIIALSLGKIIQISNQKMKMIFHRPKMTLT